MPRSFLFLILSLIAVFTQAAPEDHLTGGIPVSDGHTLLHETTGFLIGFDPDTRNPEWVAYRLKGAPRFTPEGRPSRFSDDPAIRGEFSHEDYTRSGYDRGHLASNHVIGSYFGPKAQLESFLMTNIVPQTPKANRGGPWRDIERLESGFGSRFGEVWIITGPVETTAANRMASGVSIPEGFFKIIADVDQGYWRLDAFLIPQEPKSTSLSAYLVSVDQIESLTGINFFPNMPEGWERLEGARGQLWITSSGSSTLSPSPTPATKCPEADTGQYWISSTGKTHRKGCRYYGKGNGHYGPPSGSDCNICGGAR